MAKKSIIITAVLVGTKNGGFALSYQAWGKEYTTKLAKRDGQFVPVAVLHTGDMVNTFVGRRDEYKNMTVQLVLPDSVAIKTFQLMGLLAKGHDAETSAEMATSEYDTPEHIQAYAVLAEALMASKEAGIQLRVTRQSELSGFNITVPDGVAVEEGQMLVFKNGVTEDGIKFENGMEGNYSYPVAVRRDGTFYARRPETTSSRATNALVNKTFNLVREIPNRKVDSADGVF